MRRVLLVVLAQQCCRVEALAVPKAGLVGHGRRRRGPLLSATAVDVAEERVADDKEIVAIAAPALLGTLLDPFLSVVDTAWVSRLGTVSLGAVAASSELFTLTIAVSLALRESASSTIARYIAEGRRADAARYGASVLKLAVVGGLLLAAVIGGPSAPWCVGLMGCPAGSPLHGGALDYVRARSLFLPCSLVLFAGEGVCRGAGDTKPPLKAAAVAGLLNAVLDPVLMFGPLKLGVAGAAAATGLSQLAACALLVRELAALRRRTLAVATFEAAAAPSTGGGDDDAAAARKLVRTSAALLLRSSAQLGCWVFVASEVSRKLGPAAIAAHGVVLKVWLLFVLAAEAPAVAGQVLIARHVSTGQLARARAVLSRLASKTLVCGAATALALAAAAGPAAHAFFPGDAAAAAGATHLFRWAALCVPLVWPNALFEAVLLGAGRSYKFLALSTLTNALVVSAGVAALIARRPLPSSAWQAITAFFVLRISCSGVRIFATKRGGLGFDRRQRVAGGLA